MTSLTQSFKALILALAVLTSAQTVSASDTLTDAINLQKSGVSDDVIVAWALRQPPVEPTKEAMDVIIRAKLSGRVTQALLVGNSRPGFVSQKPVQAAKPAEAQTQAQPRTDEEIQIQPAPEYVTQPQDPPVVIEGGGYDAGVYYGGIYYDPWAFYGWPYSYWSPIYGYHDHWHHGHWHDGWHYGWNGNWHNGQNGHNDSHNGFHSGVGGNGQFSGIRH